ncbi:hypothetical protein L0222_23635 [bacterium]|nr:hypothetical protein [bacterium]MCI0607363.1 hypothetical protein [bacterium]
MSTPSYLILILFLFIAQVSCAYTVVLNSGKKVEGTLISEQESTLVMKDSQGVLISLKKSLVDLKATSAANQQKAAPVISPERESKRIQPSIVEIALETKSKRTGKSKTVTASDIENAPEISILGLEVQENSRTAKTKVPGPSERDWERRLLALKREVNRLREKQISAESNCEQSKEKQFALRTTPGRKPVDLMSTYRESSQCRKFAEIVSQLREAETRLEQEREEARRAGVSWQTLE